MEIDRQLATAGWIVQSQDALNLSAGPGIAVREFTLEKPHGRVDFLPFVSGKPAGVIEAKPEGTTLTEVEHQSGKYVSGLPSWMRPLAYLCVPRIASRALTSRVARPTPARDDHRSCACSSPSFSSRG